MMKLMCLAVFVAVASADVSHLFNKPTYQQKYQPYQPYQTYQPTQYYKPTPAPVVPVYQPQPTYVRSGEAAANILRQSSDIRPDGSYEYIYETDNGIAAQQAGALKQIGNEVAVVAQGSFQYPNEAGGVQISYVADENGYQPTGNVLPTPHPIPEAIVRSIQFNEAHAKDAAPQTVYRQY